MAYNSKLEENYKRLENFIDALKNKIKNDANPLEIVKDLKVLLNGLSKINPFNNNLIDIYAEMVDFEGNPSHFKDPMKKGMIIMKLDFWKEKLRDSADQINLDEEI
ncbi:MAG: hypothetical protein ACTSU2_08365 [Promethearchaeota archaeon]